MGKRTGSEKGERERMKERQEAGEGEGKEGRGGGEQKWILCWLQRGKLPNFEALWG